MMYYLGCSYGGTVLKDGDYIEITSNESDCFVVVCDGGIIREIPSDCKGNESDLNVFYLPFIGFISFLRGII